ncbi:alpha/beta hydrolase family esterase [Streptomyces sp. NBC_00063]|uniref:alpha/beta hydrolase family esterase n=1 Tax=Streptomyces sp. NBC_00063 TaxID=2975638 RepID=UPI003D71AE83
MKARCFALLAVAALTATALTGPAAAAPPVFAAAGTRSCTLPVGRTTLTLTSGGVERTALVTRPATRNPHQALPVVLNLHGSQMTAEEQEQVSGMAAAAVENGFLAVAPQGLLDASPGYRWNVPYVTGSDGPDDENFLIDVLDVLERSGCADAGRVFGTGYSGGGREISQFACDHPDRIAAIAPVSGLRAGAPERREGGEIVPAAATCTPKRPVAVLTFHGDADPVNPYSGGGAAYWGYGAEAATRTWAHLNGCKSGPHKAGVSEHVDKVTFGGCRKGVRVQMYVVRGGGHTWPGAQGPEMAGLGAVTHEIDATGIMWDFFRVQDRAVR